MEFKTFKHHFNRTSFLTFMLFLVAMVIGVAIVGAKYNSDNSKASIARLIVIILDGFIMALIIWIMHLFKTFVGATYVVTKKTYIYNDEKTTITKFTNPWWLHLATAIFLIAIYFLSVTGMMKAYDNNWTEAAKQNWWIVLIIFVVNFCLAEFTYNLNLYKLNHDPNIVNEL